MFSLDLPVSQKEYPEIFLNPFFLLKVHIRVITPINDEEISFENDFECGADYEAMLFCPYQLLWKIKATQRKKDSSINTKIHILRNKTIVDVANILNAKVSYVLRNQNVEIYKNKPFGLLKIKHAEDEILPSQFSSKTKFVYCIDVIITRDSSAPKNKVSYLSYTLSFRPYSLQSVGLNTFLLEHIKQNYYNLLDE